MKVKNLVLFGFIASALSYLSKQVEENGEEHNLYDELEDIDLEEVQKEIGAKLEQALHEFGDVVNSIVKIGSDAFDNFLKNANGEEEKEEKFVAGDLLSQFEEVFEKTLFDEEEAVEETVDETAEELPVETEETEVSNLSDVRMEELLSKLPAQEETVEVEELEKEKEVDGAKLLEDLKEILSAFEENETDEEIFEEVKPEEEVEEPMLDEEEVEYLSRIQEAIEQNGDTPEEKDLSDLFDELFEEEKLEVQKQEGKKCSKEEIDAIFSEILEQEKIEEEAEETKEYVEELIEELQEELEEEPVEEEYEVDIYDQINELYPYLSKGFIRSVYDLKENIAQEYPCDKNVVALHRIHFGDIEDLHQFVEIVTNHNYGVNVDEDKMIVDLFKAYRNSDGKILTNIFEIANQAKLLHGDYEGYRVEVEEE